MLRFILVSVIGASIVHQVISSTNNGNLTVGQCDYKHANRKHLVFSKIFQNSSLPNKRVNNTVSNIYAISWRFRRNLSIDPIWSFVKISALLLHSPRHIDSSLIVLWWIEWNTYNLRKFLDLKCDDLTQCALIRYWL